MPVSGRKELQGQEVGAETELVNVKQIVKLQNFPVLLMHAPHESVRGVASQPRGLDHRCASGEHLMGLMSWGCRNVVLHLTLQMGKLRPRDGGVCLLGPLCCWQRVATCPQHWWDLLLGSRASPYE